MREPCIVRTTMSIDDQLSARAKGRARDAGVSLGAYVEAALRRELASADGPGPAPRAKRLIGAATARTDSSD